MKIEVVERTPKSTTRSVPLLFVHGMWHGAWCWDEFFLPFFAEQGYHTAALSLRGHAGSEGSIRGSTIADYVADVEQIVKTFVTHPVLIGHSMGGFVIQKYLEKQNAPAGVMLASSPHYGLWPATLRVLMHSPLKLLKAIAQRRLYPVVEEPRVARWALFSNDMTDEQFMKYHGRLSDESFRAYMDLLGLNLVRPGKVKTPLLVVGGDKDAVIHPKDVRDTARAYNTQAEIIPNMPHEMMLETGWRSVAEKILIWLREKGI